MKKTEIKLQQERERARRERFHKPEEAPAVYRSREFLEFAAFLAMGTGERKDIFGFYTEADFAKGNNVSVDTLWRWKMRPELWAERDKHLVALRRHTGAILSRLATRAMTQGAAYDVETWMRLVEGYAPKTKVEGHAAGLADIVKAELEQDDRAAAEAAKNAHAPNAPQQDQA